jgi:hypothetical protein
MPSNSHAALLYRNDHEERNPAVFLNGLNIDLARSHGRNDRVILPGDPEPLWLRRETEHRRELALLKTGNDAGGHGLPPRAESAGLARRLRSMGRSAE